MTDSPYEAKWPFPTTYLVGVRRSDGSIEHYHQEGSDPLAAREFVEKALLETKAVLVRVK
jgi:hypothetical protein